jgi:hypothetical protein
MIIGALQIEIEIPGAMSLKDKRSVVKSIKDSCHRHHMVSASEIGAQDVWNRAILGFAMTGVSGAAIGAVLDRVTQRVASAPGCEIIGSTRTVAHVNDLEPAGDIDTDAIDDEIRDYAREIA